MLLGFNSWAGGQHGAIHEDLIEPLGWSWEVHDWLESQCLGVNPDQGNYKVKFLRSLKPLDEHKRWY